ncbi:putative beta-lactamase [Cellvibrio sp. BR]|uniref:serine hydrolase domain-containing protein n=1 Tax=Cellvibrio sp. BR TaxID=1134474 RepID=UPI0002600E37|nr:serine hydrolase domain-containing protein [Cellvibrio sp. BR]EIK44544.1 putative beta-lactamase [Cellvibrio sp. BR]
MHPPAKTLSNFAAFVMALTLLTSEFVQSTELHKTGCITPTGSIEEKMQLENEIRSQVKFLDEEEVLASITHKMSEYKIPSLSLAVIKQGEIEWADTYQNARFPQQQLDCTSLFQAASLSKPVTFMAVVRMQTAGKIDLDKNIQHYLKTFVLPAGKQTAANPVTLRNIFSHTSGITPGGYQGYAKNLALPSDIDIVKGGAGVNSAAIAVITPPNKTLAYSGGAYTLAELALQDIHDTGFASLMKKWILDPVGMKYSEFTQPLTASKFKQVAKGYTSTGEVLEGGWRNYPEQAAAGLWSTSIDMATFLTEIYKGYHGKSALFSQLDIRSLISHERDGHTYGFILNRTDDDVVITHYGGNTGYNTGMTISLTSGNGLVYLINSDNGWELGRDLFLSASYVYQWKTFKQTDVQRKPVNNAILKTLQGKYKWNKKDDFTVRFDEKSNFISLLYPGGTEYKLTPVVGDNLTFIHANTGTAVTFLIENEVKSFHLYGGIALKQN